MWIASVIFSYLIFATYLVNFTHSRYNAPLLLNDDGTFKLSVFADLHYGENESTFGIPADINSTKLMNYVLDAEQPNFVILNGDLITGENTFAFNSTKYVDVIVAPMVEKGYSWGSTYGNHDSKYNLTRKGILQEEHKYNNSYTTHGPPGTKGVSNYMVPIYRSATENPVALLWFFDSRGGSRGDPDNVDNIPNWVSKGTAEWFENAAMKAQSKWGTLPSLAFVHIPMKAFLDLQQSSADVSGHHYPGLNADKPLAQQGTGPQSKHFMEALLNTPGVHSVYSGHDHGDSWCGRWPNSTLPGDTPSRPFLCFCKHSGFGGYGPWKRGVRQVELVFDEDNNMAVNTWVRMQQKTIVTWVSLNETYGQDKYPTADGEPKGEDEFTGQGALTHG